MKQIVHNDWDQQLAPFFDSDIYQNLREFLKQEYQQTTVYPNMNHIYSALKLTPYEQVKVVILGQDPYHGPKQANGLAFSVQPEVAVPPSLRNIYKELSNDLGVSVPAHGDLTFWAEQGVLLLNTVLTVRAGSANSHRGQGWEALTDFIIDRLNEHPHPLVFILWGKPAQNKITRIDTSRHAIIESSHPSPLAAYRGFFGSQPFSRTNTYLRGWGLKEIDWEIK